VAGLAKRLSWILLITPRQENGGVLVLINNFYPQTDQALALN